MFGRNQCNDQAYYCNLLAFLCSCVFYATSQNMARTADWREGQSYEAGSYPDYLSRFILNLAVIYITRVVSTAHESKVGSREF